MTLIDATHVRNLVIKPYSMTCDNCQFTTHDIKLMDNHNCDIQNNGGHCEDFPACGHEYGDCNGERYGSDEAIIEQCYRDMDNEDNMGTWDMCDDEDCVTLGSCIC